MSQGVCVSQIQKYYNLISKGQIKLITSLQQKKYRIKTGLFVAEGPKIIKDLAQAGLEIHSLYAAGTSQDQKDLTKGIYGFSEEPVSVSQRELQKISGLKTANSVLAVFHQPKQKEISESGLLVALDSVRDPGNLGTIIRLCDWFGVQHIICNLDTADCFNPKVVQATMGSIGRVAVHYLDLSAYLQQTKLPVYAAIMDGDTVYTSNLPKSAILVMGNEASGISASLNPFINHGITIPHFGGSDTAESLNVATATGILLSEFRRNSES